MKHAFNTHKKNHLKKYVDQELTFHICVVHVGQQEAWLPGACGWGSGFPPGGQMGRCSLALKDRI